MDNIGRSVAARNNIDIIAIVSNIGIRQGFGNFLPSIY